MKVTILHDVNGTVTPVTLEGAHITSQLEPHGGVNVTIWTANPDGGGQKVGWFSALRCWSVWVR
jgi:hypothetical protein